ncbi:hypothetical protein [Thalassoroseus pseudoceratinae]|uniref:hypothetical protein n=1 Tax=Thalassoroseus pseudoceratinae TaxID=2713176 RepID=UPI00141F7E16|nr:hypothetical protein [Thalassoroseus pseudoceratinae]
MLGMASVLPESRRDWFQLAVNGLWMGPAVIVFVLACRRFVGAFADGMTEPAVCLVASGTSVLVLLAVALERLNFDEFQESFDFRWRTAIQLAPAIVVGWLLLVSPSEATIAFLTIQTVSVATIGWGITRLQHEVLADIVLAFSKDPFLRQPTTEHPTLKVSIEPPATEASSEQEEMFHEMTRRHVLEDETGWDVLQGVLTVDFQPNQRKVALHIPICPPMHQLPETECVVLDDDTADVDISSVHPYGVRLEVRRPSGKGNARVRLDYTIASELTSPTRHVA